MLGSLIVVNVLAKVHRIVTLSWWHILYLLLVMILLVVTIKDIIKKNSINKNNMYNLLSIGVFLIMNIVLLRAIYDPHFIYNNTKLMNELNNYSYELFGQVLLQQDDMFPTFYVSQNISYFLMMISLLFVYRILNKERDTKKT